MARNARRASQAPPPSSPAIGPQPPAQKLLPRELIPQQIDPVPAITTSPGAPPVAPYRAISASVTTSMVPIPRLASDSRMRSRNSRRRAPAKPISAATRSVLPTFAMPHPLSLPSPPPLAPLPLPPPQALNQPPTPRHI